MIHTLRARLIFICVAITAAALLALSAVTFWMARSSTLEHIDVTTGQLTAAHAQALADWVQDKQRITSSIKNAVGLEEPIPFLLAAKQAGGFDDAYFVYADRELDKRHVFAHPMPPNYDGTKRDWFKQGLREVKPSVTPAYIDATPGELTISCVEAAGPAGA